MSADPNLTPTLLEDWKRTIRPFMQRGQGSVSSEEWLASCDRIEAALTQIEGLRNAMRPFAALCHADGVEAPYPVEKWTPWLIAAERALRAEPLPSLPSPSFTAEEVAKQLMALAEKWRASAVESIAESSRIRSVRSDDSAIDRCLLRAEMWRKLADELDERVLQTLRQATPGEPKEKK